MMELQLRAFTNEGIQEFDRILDDAKNGIVIPDSRRSSLLDSGRVIAPNVRAPSVHFQNRLEAGKALVRLLAGLSSHMNDRGMWAWLSLYYFDTVCPIVSGEQRVEQRERYIPDLANFRLYYRHLLYGPFSIYRAHSDNPERAMVVLCTPVHRPGDAVEQLASRQDLITSPTVMQVATDLYVRNGKHKRGTGNKDKGAARRFADVMMQFDTTYDLDQISVQDLLNLLPQEFDKFRR